MHTGYVRNLSGLENMYRAFEREHAFYIQWILNFDALPQDLNWRATLERSLACNPGAAMRLASAWSSKKWKATAETPPFSENNFDGALDDALMALPKSLSEKGPVAELRKINYAGGTALVFRSLHSAMDGSGLLSWLSDCIKIINDLPPRGHTAAFSDHELCVQLTPMTLSPAKVKTYQPLTCGKAPNFKPFFRLTMPGTAKGLSKKLCRILRRYAQTKKIHDLHFLIPSDLRKYKESMRSTGNLTGILNIEVSSDMADDEIDRQIKHEISSLSDARYVKQINVWKFFPVLLSTAVFNVIKTTGKFLASGIISNVGDVSAADMAIKGICPRNVFCIAPYSGFHPLFIVGSSFDNLLTLTFAIPEQLQGNAEELIQFVKSELQQKSDLYN